MESSSDDEMVSKKDISNRSDLEVLISQFYQELLRDKEMNHIFMKVAALDLAAHLPILVDFWEGVLFQSWKYQANVMGKHMDLNQKYKLKEEHFAKWLSIFRSTLQDNFSGPNADQVWKRAQSIAAVMQIKLGVVK